MTNESDWYRDHALLLSRLKDDHQPVAGPQSADTTRLKPQQQVLAKKVGRFHVERVIASGGMGTVYEAIQEHPRRSVAVKVMRRGVASHSALRRFEYESQILARLRHPGIAQIYEAGTQDDPNAPGEPVPFFAMEYIPGAKPITAYAIENRLSTRRRLELFAQVCEAIHHGHQKGIIHRDLKPSNILVDPDGHVKIIDFGVARGTDSDLAITTLQTDIGHLIGTVQYMSPEQCAADPDDIDTRSDVYALGVVLYELLSDSLPYDVSNMPVFESTRVIREQPPTRLSTIDPTLKGDTETIVLKALEKERERRYQSATELARDIRHYLAGEAIAARPPSLAYQLQVFARRNRVAFGAAAVVFVVLIAASIVSTFLYVRAEDQRIRAAAAEQEQSRERQRAQVNFELAREAVDQMLTRVAEELKDYPQMEHVRRELLEDARAFYERFLEEQGDDAAVRFESGQACRRLGYMHGLLGRQARAEADYARAIGIFETLAAESDKPKYSAVLADVHFELARLARTGSTLEALYLLQPGLYGWDKKRLPEAEQHCRKALAIHERLAAEFPKKPEYTLRVAGDHNELVRVFFETERLTEAEEAQRHSQAILEQLAAELPDRPEYRKELAESYFLQGVLLYKADRKADGERAFRQSVALREELVSEFPEDAEYRRGLAHTLETFGTWLRHRDPQLGEDTIRRAIEQYEQLAADFTGVPIYKRLLADSLHDLKRRLEKTGRHEEAEEHLRRRIAFYEGLAADFPNVPAYRQTLVWLHGDLGEIHGAAGRYQDGEGAFRRALSQGDELIADYPDDPQYRYTVARAHHRLGLMLNKADRLEGHRERQEAAYRQSLAVMEQLSAEFPDDPEYRNCVDMVLSNLGLMLGATGRHQEAEHAYRRAVSQCEELVADFPNVAEYRERLYHIHNNYGAMLDTVAHRLEDRERQEAAYRQAIAVMEQLSADFPDDSQYRNFVARALSNLGLMLKATGRYQEAEDAFRRAVSWSEALVADFPDRPRYTSPLVMYLRNFAGLLAATGRHQEAEETYRRAISLCEELTTAYPAESYYERELARSLYQLANLLWQQLDRLREAREALCRSVSLSLDLEAESPGSTKGLLRNGLANLVLVSASSRDSRVEDVLEALKLAERAVELAPDKGDFWNMLGVVRYRAGDSRGAVEAQNKAVGLGYALDVMDLFFLAMAQSHVGDQQQARRTFDRAVQWMDHDWPDHPAFLGFRAEAAELLGIDEEPTTDEKGDDPSNGG